jgi:hypothetical protein
MAQAVGVAGVEDTAGIGIHHNGCIRRLVSAIATMVGMMMAAGARLCGIAYAACQDRERGKADNGAVDCGQNSRTMAAHQLSPSLDTRGARSASRTRRSLFVLARA